MLLPLLPVLAVAGAPPPLRLVTPENQAAEAEPSPNPATQLLPRRSDEDLVALTLSGHRGAARALYERHVDRVLLRATRLLKSRFEAQDVAQDAFLEAYRDLSQLREPARFGAWLDRIAAHQVHRRFRKRRVLELLGLRAILGTNQRRAQEPDELTLDQLAAPGADPSIGVQLKQLDDLLRAASANERMAWMLRRIDALSLNEVAEQCRCSLATAKRRIAGVDRLLSATFVVPTSAEEPADDNK